MADSTIRSGSADLGLAIGFDKHPRGAFDADPESMGIGAWYGETGMMLTTQFFAMKIRRYMHLHGISTSTLAKVGVKAFENGSMNPNAWRRTPMTEEQVAGSTMVSDPLTQFMFCSPGEGAVALVLCRADKARQYTDRPVYLDAVSFVTRRYGTFEVFSPDLAIERADGPTVDAARAAFEQAGIGPDDTLKISLLWPMILWNGLMPWLLKAHPRTMRLAIKRPCSKSCSVMGRMKGPCCRTSNSYTTT
jgi:acetyl-CoA acetyltransferase